MKRFTILAIVAAGCAAICLGQRRSRPLLLRVVQLAEPKLSGKVSLEEALTKRRSVRQFTGQPLKPTHISQLAWAGQGITEPVRGLRTAPSAGAIYPIDLYFATPQGLFVYRPKGHGMEQVVDQDVRGILAAAAGTPQATLGAGCHIIIAGSIRKLTPRFRNDAKKYMLLEAGHIAQNIQLQAVCLELGSVTIGGFDIGQVRKVCRMARTLEPIYLICVGHPAGQPTDEPGPTTAKRAVLIAAREGFRDEELFETRRVLDGAGIQTVVASTIIGPVRGALGRTTEATILVNQIKVDDFDAVIFIGGPGAREYFDNPVAWNIARQAASRRKVLAAICIAPTILANAGLLRGTRVTGFLSERERLQMSGARYTGEPVERDGLIITASGPMASVQFGRAVAEALAGR